MSSTPIVLSGISRTALLQLLELAGNGARVDIELPPSLSSLKQARIHATCVQAGYLALSPPERDLD
jgi:hypothetical protein